MKFAGMQYHRGGTLAASRGYVCNALGLPTSRSTARQGTTRNDTFTHNGRSELVGATLGTVAYSYGYDNVGNRKSAQEDEEEATSYAANNLNQYTSIQEDEAAAFVPSYDADGNQTKVRTGTGVWNVSYNAENRPVTFASADGTTVVECEYDYLGRRATRKITVNGSVASYLRYIYRGYLQIAAINPTASSVQWLVLWNPTEEVATRPLAMRKDGTWYTFGWDLTKNVCEVFTSSGLIGAAYSYAPYGEVEGTGSVEQPFQWSSEYCDEELGMVYYNYRHYNPRDGRWIGRDLIREIDGHNKYYAFANNTTYSYDYLGLAVDTIWDIVNVAWDLGVIAIGSITDDSEMVEEGTTDLTADVIATLIPGLPAGMSKAGRAGKEAVKKLEKTSAGKTVKKASQKRVDDVLQDAERSSGEKTPPNCKPCNLPAGTLSYEIASKRKSGRHSRECFQHVKLWVVNQSPYPACECYWNFYLTLDNVAEPPSGSINLSDKPEGCPPKTSMVPGGGPIKKISL